MKNLNGKEQFFGKVHVKVMLSTFAVSEWLGRDATDEDEQVYDAVVRQELEDAWRNADHVESFELEWQFPGDDCQHHTCETTLSGEESDEFAVDAADIAEEARRAINEAEQMMHVE